MTFRDQKRPRGKRLLIIALAVAAGLLLVYAAAGFWVIPSVAKSVLPDLIAAQLPVNAAVGEIHFNPFLLTLSVRDFTVKENDGRHLVGLKELYANLQLSSIFRWAVFFKEVRLTEPDALVQILPDGRLNVLNVLPKSDEPENANADKPAQLPTVEVDRFVLEGGKVVLRDLTSKTPFEAALFPIQVAFNGLTTRTDTESGFQFSAGTDRGEQFSGEGHLMIQPIAARGALSASGIDIRRLWQAVADAVNFEITDGRLDLAGGFAVQLSPEGLQLQLTEGRVDLKRFSLAEKGEPVPLVSVPSFSIAGAGIDLKQRHIRVESVQTDDARIQTWLSPDGTVQLLNVLLPESDPSGETPSIPKPEKAPAFDRDEWNFQIDTLSVRNAGIELQDRSLSPPVPLAYGPITLSVKNMSNQPNAKASIALDVRDEFGGQFDISGQIGITPVMAGLKVRVVKAAVEKIEPYVRAIADVDVVSGNVDAEGQLTFTGSGPGPKLQYRGAVRVDNMEIITAADRRDLVKFASLAVNGMQIDLQPNNIRISEIMLDKPQGNLIIEADGNLNVNQVMATVKAESTEIAGSLPGRVVRAIKENIRGPVPLRIDAMRVRQASATFEDRSLKPAFAMKLDEVEGEMTDISPTERTPVKVRIDGKIDASSPLSISGSLIPFGEKTDMDMRVSLKNFRLRSISPYSGKHVGYTIRRGQLSLALEYRLSEDIIDGKNEVFLRQLTLGERTDSPDAVSLPLGLAVALLKDAKGNIKFNIPVSGDINDPEFSVGNVFASTLIKFVTGIVSSPFKVMGGLAGAFSTAELDRVTFAPGSSTVENEQVEKLVAVAKALRERPFLQLEIRGRAYRGLDGKALAAAQSEGGSAATSAVNPEQLRELARQRATTVRNALVFEGKIESKRVTVLPEKVEESSADGQAICTLQLTAD